MLCPSAERGSWECPCGGVLDAQGPSGAGPQRLLTVTSLSPALRHALVAATPLLSFSTNSPGSDYSLAVPAPVPGLEQKGSSALRPYSHLAMCSPLGQTVLQLFNTPHCLSAHLAHPSMGCAKSSNEVQVDNTHRSHVVYQAVISL